MSQSSVPAGAPLSRLLGGPRRRLRIALGSAVTLVVGFAIAPEPAPRTLTTPQGRAVPLLEATDAERLQSSSLRLEDLPGRVQKFAVLVEPPAPSDPQAPTVRTDYGTLEAAVGVTPLYGVLVSVGGDVLTHAAGLGPAREPVRLVVGGARVDASIRAFEPQTGLVLLRAHGPASAAPAFGAPPKPGSVLAAVAGTGDRTIVLPLHVSRSVSGRIEIARPVEGLAPGMPVYALSGALVGIVGEGGVAFPADEAARRLRDLVARRRGMPTSIGIGVQSITPPLAATVGAAGVLVAEIVPGGPAAAAGLREGDVLLALGGVPVTSPEDAERIASDLPVNEEVAVAAARGSEAIGLTIEPRPALDVWQLARAAPPPPAPAGPTLGAVFPAEQIARSGLPGSARIITIDRRAVASATEARAFVRRARESVLVQIEHQDRRYFAAIGVAR